MNLKVKISNFHFPIQISNSILCYNFSVWVEVAVNVGVSVWDGDEWLAQTYTILTRNIALHRWRKLPSKWKMDYHPNHPRQWRIRLSLGHVLFLNDHRNEESYLVSTSVVGKFIFVSQADFAHIFVHKNWTKTFFLIVYAMVQDCGWIECSFVDFIS